MEVAPAAYELPKQGAGGGRAAAVGAVPNPCVWGALLTAPIPIHSSLSTLPNLSQIWLAFPQH